LPQTAFPHEKWKLFVLFSAFFFVFRESFTPVYVFKLILNAHKLEAGVRFSPSKEIYVEDVLFLFGLSLFLLGGMCPGFRAFSISAARNILVV